MKKIEVKAAKIKKQQYPTEVIAVFNLIFF